MCELTILSFNINVTWLNWNIEWFTYFSFFLVLFCLLYMMLFQFNRQFVVLWKKRKEEKKIYVTRGNQSPLISIAIRGQTSHMMFVTIIFFLALGQPQYSFFFSLSCLTKREEERLIITISVVAVVYLWTIYMYAKKI